MTDSRINDVGSDGHFRDSHHADPYDDEQAMSRRAWLVTYRALLVVILGTAALNMLGLRAGFLTNHAADVVVPAWLYIVFRGLYSSSGRTTRIQRALGSSPELAASSLLVASAITEFSQRVWPRGLFPGRFDWWDLAAFSVGLAVCFVLDKRSQHRTRRESAASI